MLTKKGRAPRLPVEGSEDGWWLLTPASCKWTLVTWMRYFVWTVFPAPMDPDVVSDGVTAIDCRCNSDIAGHYARPHSRGRLESGSVPL